MHGPISFVICDQSNHNQGSVCVVFNKAIWLYSEVVIVCIVSPGTTVCIAPVNVGGYVNLNTSPTFAPCTLKSYVNKSFALFNWSHVLFIVFHVKLLKLSLVKVTNAPDLTPGWSGKLLEDSPGTKLACVRSKFGAYLAKYAKYTPATSCICTLPPLCNAPNTLLTSGPIGGGGKASPGVYVPAIIFSPTAAVPPASGAI